MRIFWFLLLILIAPFALAVGADGGGMGLGGGAGLGGGVGTAGSIFTVPNMDQSVIFLSEIFGQVGSVIGGASNGPLQSAILLFNNVALVMGGFVILYSIVVSTINTAHDGELLGKNWSSVWIPLRAAAGFSLLLPVKAGGYAFCQVVVMWIVLQGIGAADYVWGMYLKEVQTGNATPQIPYVSQYVMPSMASIFQNAACTIGLANQQNQQLADVPDAPSAQPVIAFPSNDKGFFIRFTTSTSRSPIVCGTLKLQAYPPAKGGSNAGNFVPTAPNGGQNANGSAFSKGPDLLNQFKNYQNSDPTIAQRRAAEKNNQLLTNVTQSLNEAAIFYVTSSNYCSNNTDKACINEVQRQIINAAMNYTSQWAEGNSKTRPSDMSSNSQDVMQDLNQAKQYGWLYAGAYYILLSKITSADTNNVSGATVKGPAPMGQSGGADSDITNYQQSIQAQYVAQITQMCGKVGSAVNQTGTGSISMENGQPTKGQPFAVPCIPPDLNTSGPAQSFNVAFVSTNGNSSGNFASVVAGVTNCFEDIFNWFIQVLTSQAINPVVALSTFGQEAVPAVLAVMAFITVTVPVIASAVGMIPYFGKALEAGIGIATDYVIIPLMGLFGMTLGFAAMAGYYIPLVPYILFTAGALAWFVLVIEAMVAAPIIALGIVHPEGSHTVWGHGGKGIMILIGIFLRPALMIVGFIAASLLVYIAFQILNGGFQIAITFLGAVGLGPFLLVFSLMVYVSLATYLMHQCFKMIHKMPDTILRWVGESSENTGQDADQEVNQGGQKASGSGETIGKGGAQLVKGKREQAKQTKAQADQAKAAEEENKENKPPDSEV